MKELKRYRLSLILLAVALLIWMWQPPLGQDISVRTANIFREMLGVLPPIFILLGLLEAWVPREMIIKNLGETSGARGIALSIFLGAAAAGPLYVAFPVAVTMLKKGARFGNIVIFLFSWSTLKLPLLLFETSALGWQFATARAAVNIPGIILMGLLVERLIPAEEKEALRQRHIQEEISGQAVPAMR
ncbi:MAG: permease [Dethiobacter sp.]|jgi:uncharacterized membrane protein YraQ (UPF0718 family)|nr:permease [Dethiobacter sp.]